MATKNSLSVHSKPRHRLLTKDKSEKDYFQPTMDYYIKNSGFYDSYYDELDILYTVADGKIDDRHYRYVLNPTNTNNEQFTRYPAQLRNYDIIGPVLNLFLGETGRRPNNPTVVAPTANAVSQFKQKKANSMTVLLAQDFVNNLNGAGIPTGVPSKPVPDYPSASKKFDESYEDAAAKVGQEALNYLMYDLEFDEKILQMMYDWLVAGTVWTYKDVYMNDVDYEICDPRDIYVHGMKPQGYGEDAEAIVYRKEMTRSELIDAYNEELEERKDDTGESYMSIIDKRQFGGAITAGPVMYRTDPRHEDRFEWNGINEGKAIVYIVAWQGMKKVGTLYHYDPTTGQLVTREVDDTYKLDKDLGDIKIDWEWVNCWYTGHCIDSDLYVRMGEGLVQRNEINNNATNKLPFNGCFYGYRNKTIRSVVKSGLPYAILYNIMHFRFEFALAKHRNRMTAFPYGLVPKKDGWDEDKWFYWGSVHDFLMYDETAPNAAAAIQGIKDVGGAVGNYVVEMWNILGGIKEEWWDAAGVNRQRLGGTMASDGKAVSEQAVFRSSLITDNMFYQLDKFLEKEYEGLLDNSKIAWIDGKKGSYITSDGFRAWLEVDGPEFLSTELGVFVSNSREEYDKLNQGKQLLQVMGQNGLKAPGLLEVLDAKNFSKIKELAKRAIQAEEELIEASREADRQSQENIQAMQSADKQRESEDKRYVADTGASATIEAARIRAGVDLQKLYNDTLEMRSELTNELGEDRLSNLEARSDFIKNDLAQQNLNIKNRQLDAKMYSDATKLKVARENRNRYDKK